MPFLSFSPQTVIKSADINSNFSNAVHKTDVQVVSNKIMVPGIITATDQATITFDLSLGSIQEVTLGGDRTLALSNVNEGQPFILKLIQDGTGNRLVTWFSTIKWDSGITPLLSTVGNKADIFGFICTGPGTYDGFIIAQYL